MWQDEVSHLNLLDQNLVESGKMGGKKKEKERKEKREEEKMSEKLQLLSRFYGDRTIGFRRNKRQSSSTRRELCVGTRIWDFRQTLRGRSFSLTLFNSCLRVIQMDEVFGAGTAVQFSPKIWD